MRIEELLNEDLNRLKDFKEDVEHTLDRLIRLPETINWYIEKGGIPLPQMAKIIDKYKTEILETFHDNWYLIDKSQMLGSLLKLNLRWPELKDIQLNILFEILDQGDEDAIDEIVFSHDIIDAKKDIIIKKILESMKHGDQEFPEKLLDYLAPYNLDWPELAIIQRSLAADASLR